MHLTVTDVGHVHQTILLLIVNKGWVCDVNHTTINVVNHTTINVVNHAISVVGIDYVYEMFLLW